ncbi:MAG: O-linked N-acetylglucosamine transferase, SPINDLY family protein [Spirulinaceae cyanobacterium]
MQHPQQQADQAFLNADYPQAAQLYEQAVKLEPENRRLYWYWGLALLLQNQATEAQTTWLLGVMQDEDTEAATGELVAVLETEAQRYAQAEKLSEVVQIRSVIQELAPGKLENLLKLYETEIELNVYTGDRLTELGLLEYLQAQHPLPLTPEALIAFTAKVVEFDPFHPNSFALAQACLGYLQTIPQAEQYLNAIFPKAQKLAETHKQPGFAIQYSELCWQIAPDNRKILHDLVGLYQNANQHETSIETARHYCALSANQSLSDRMAANQQLLRSLMTAGGYWQEAEALFYTQQELLQELIATYPLEQLQVPHIILHNFFAPYFGDNPAQMRKVQNQLGELSQTKLQLTEQDRVSRYQQQHQNRKAHSRLKIGYLSGCFRYHSVGWLARWLIQYHDRSRFEVYGYFANCDPVIPDTLHDWYLGHFDHTYKSSQSQEIADKIAADEIDILIDLDSVTSGINMYVTMLKPAPIQVSWLGWDASGIPAIDYYIADPDVLLDEAEDYYAEKIWRLPQTYIAVEGFEVGVPTLRRDELGIPVDAIVYFSAQRGYKRHPETTRLQMQILQQVPNSYFLIKGIGDETSIRAFFEELAEAEGVSRDRLRFLPISRSEAEHRANLSLADVVLDTYPYNGATTTLETLWMGVPMVTRVGRQFSARNSYTMLRNAGITEGIAETPAEYVIWGVRFGTEAALRARVAWKLRQSRHSAPLWNARQFTREMEKAYEQMWESKYSP